MPEKDSKLEALREQGTLNPRPREVTDPLFAKDSFFDPRDLVQVKSRCCAACRATAIR